MDKESEQSDRKKTVLAIVAGIIFVTAVAVCIFALNGKPLKATPTEGEQGVKFRVCELDTKLIVVIDESDFNPIVYSKNLDDCK